MKTYAEFREAVRNRVMDVLPPAPAGWTLIQIHNAVQGYGVPTIEKACRELIQEGLIVKGGSFNAPVYRRTT